ncbi:hypothetical protein EDC18_11276 [Natranaerovirga pectinivora]|uniref:Phosphotransferase system EIIC domain-containing protein n=1 Tax=Natranaerovirga pectinivora TaxID=682400 RepID=A0A4R3MIJ6_9FIRM|nr:PTS sugar transporter subunit IIC [Natranaerovirga pectinivora]TCT12304.1 hypothetical protein EDC18_11276 [Natranaerovirga pectinivora]
MKEKIKQIFKHIFIDGFSGMALGLFCTLIVGLIIQQLGDVIGGNFGSTLRQLGTMATITTGAGIGIGVAHKFKAPPLLLYSSAVTGLIGAYAGRINSGAMFDGSLIVIAGPGDPLGAFIAAMVGYEIGKLIAGKTKLDIILTPIVTIVSGGLIGLLVGPPISSFMLRVGEVINWSMGQIPFIMGIVVAVVMGMILTLPISSAALAIILSLDGLVAGAATVGCAAQMVGFAVSSYRENKVGGLLAQGLGTSMLQVPNIMRKPVIWLPPIITSAILGPLATTVFFMENNAAGAGMGTSGLVGQLMTWRTMIGNETPGMLLFKILLLHFILPALLTLGISEWMRKKQIIKFGDLQLDT